MSQEKHQISQIMFQLIGLVQQGHSEYAQDLCQQQSKDETVQNEEKNETLKIPWVMTLAHNLPKFESVGKLHKKTIVITGGSRGIGLEMAKRFARDGCNIIILAKTVTPHPKLPGTIYTAAKEIEAAGAARVLPLQCDVREEEQVAKSIQTVIQNFGGIDILINNASAIIVTGTEDTTMKRYDMSHAAGVRASFMLSKYCLPHLLKAKNAHILNISPPLTFNRLWLRAMPYGIQKWGMSMCVLGMAEEFREQRIAVNALWPRTTIATSVVVNLSANSNVLSGSLSTTLMADAAYTIVTSNSAKTTGNFFIDDQVLAASGVHDLSVYKLDQKTEIKQLFPDPYL